MALRIACLIVFLTLFVLVQARYVTALGNAGGVNPDRSNFKVLLSRL